MVTSAHPRLDNLLAALTLNLGEEAAAALEEATGVAGSAASALLALDEFLGDAHVGRLADVLGLTHSGAVRLVTQLERAGLAARQAGADRRRVEVRLTPRGRRRARGRVEGRLTPRGRGRARAARTARARLLQQPTSDLTDVEADALEELLGKLVAARVEERIERRRPREPGPWWCRTCDFAACGRPEGQCPAQAAAARMSALSDAGGD